MLHKCCVMNCENVATHALLLDKDRRKPLCIPHLRWGYLENPIYERVTIEHITVMYTVTTQQGGVFTLDKGRMIWRHEKIGDGEGIVRGLQGRIARWIPPRVGRQFQIMCPNMNKRKKDVPRIIRLGLVHSIKTMAYQC